MSQIAIKGATTGTGVFTLESPATNTNRTLVLPDEAGTVLTSAGVPASAMPAGSVLQVVSTNKTDTFTTTSLSWVDLTGFSVNITPSSSSNKVMILCDLKMSGTDYRGGCSFRLLRNGTVINVGDAAGSRIQTTGGWEDLPSAGQYMVYSQNAMFLDSPLTTSAVTYKVQVILNDNFGTLVVNRTGADGDSSAYVRTASNLTVMEIAG